MSKRRSKIDFEINRIDDKPEQSDNESKAVSVQTIVPEDLAIQDMTHQQ
ncbi:MAG: hypothetical protein ACKN9W_01240 [Methylococcus sp.]